MTERSTRLRVGLALAPALLFAYLVGGAQLAAGQAKAPPAPPDTQDSPPLCSGSGDAKPSKADLAGVQGVVLGPSEKPPGVEITLRDTATKSRLIKKLASCKGKDGKSGGRFIYSLEVQPGSYQITLSGSDYDTEAVVPLELKANEVRRLDFALKERGISFAFLLPLLYIATILFIRWNNIAKPSRVGVIAQLRDLKGQFPNDPGLTAELQEARDSLVKRATPWEWLFWSRGQEMACWNLVHKAEIVSLKSLTLAEINARLATAQQALLEIDKSSAKSLAGRIDQELKSGAAAVVDSEARRQLLTEATTYIFDSRDTDFSSLTSWQNKAFWLTLVGVILIWAVATMMDHRVLFVAGAAGGFLSRLNRQLKRADVPTDYGASWSTLFLSPVAGALSGWFGVALIMWLHDLDVLGKVITVSWHDPNNPATLGAAFVLGFSERLFDGLVSQLENTIDKKKQDTQKTEATNPPVQTGDDKSGDKPLSPGGVKQTGDVGAQPANVDPGKKPD